MKTICGIDCAECHFSEKCAGCVPTDGRPFGGDCIVAECTKREGSVCGFRQQLIAAFNALGIEDMPEVTELHALAGFFVNLEYLLPSGQSVKFWDDKRIYLGNQLHKEGSERCYGLVADERDLMVCEYGENGAEPEIVVYKRWN